MKTASTNYSRIFLWLIFLSISKCSIAQEKWQKVYHLLDSLFPNNQPGIAVGIVEDGKTVFVNGFGVANMVTKEKITSATNFNIASLTKQFTATGILQLQEKGKLQLSDKLISYFPNMNKKVAEKVTIQELMTHSSGIIDHYSLVSTKTLKHGYAKDVYASIKDVDSFYFPPGTSYRYSNTAYCLLGLILEKESRLNYKDFVKKNIFNPIHMTHSTVWSDGENIYKQAIGYDKDSSSNTFIKSQAEEHVFFTTEGDGAIYTSIDDYLKWFQGIQKQQLLSAKDILNTRTIQNPIATYQRLGYGYGWFVNKNQYPTYIYHSGDNGGFRTYSFTIPTLDYLVVIFANRSDINIEEIVNQINLIIHPELAPLIPIEKLTS